MTKVMTIEGMMCGHCTGRVQKALEAIEGVSAVTMSLEAKTATVDPLSPQRHPPVRPSGCSAA